MFRRGGQRGRAGLSIWGKARSQGQKASRGTPGAVHPAPSSPEAGRPRPPPPHPLQCAAREGGAEHLGQPRPLPSPTLRGEGARRWGAGGVGLGGREGLRESTLKSHSFIQQGINKFEILIYNFNINN